MLTSLLFVLVALYSSTPCHASLNLPINSINLSGCKLTGSKTFSGDLTAYNAMFGSLIVTNGSVDLENTTISEELMVEGSTRIKNCSLSSLSTDGPTILGNTIITRDATTIGSLNCTCCTIKGDLVSSGNLNLYETSVTGNTRIDKAAAVISHAQFSSLTITGVFDGNTITSSTLSTDGSTRLTASNINKTANLSGTTQCFDCCFANITGTGTALFVRCHANDASISGNIAVEQCSFETLTTHSEAVTLLNSSVETLYAEANPDGKPTTITIDSNDASFWVERIVCQDPNTHIMYKKNARRARQIIGTTNIKQL